MCDEMWEEREREEEWQRDWNEMGENTKETECVREWNVGANPVAFSPYTDYYYTFLRYCRLSSLATAYKNVKSNIMQVIPPVIWVVTVLLMVGWSLCMCVDIYIVLKTGR